MRYPTDTSPTHFIDGAWRASQGQDTIEVTDPATNTVWGSVPVGNEDDVNAEFTTGPWSKTTPSERAEIMLHIAEEIGAVSPSSH